MSHAPHASPAHPTHAVYHAGAAHHRRSMPQHGVKRPRATELTGIVPASWNNSEEATNSFGPDSTACLIRQNSVSAYHYSDSPVNPYEKGALMKITCFNCHQT